MWTRGKRIVCRLKEYQKTVYNERFRFYEPILPYASHLTRRKTYFMWRKGITENYLKTKDSILITNTIIPRSYNPEENTFHVD